MVILYLSLRLVQLIHDQVSSNLYIFLVTLELFRSNCHINYKIAKFYFYLIVKIKIRSYKFNFFKELRFKKYLKLMLNYLKKKTLY